MSGIDMFTRKRLNEAGLVDRFLAARRRAEIVAGEYWRGVLVAFSDDELAVLDRAGYLSRADLGHLVRARRTKEARA